MRMFMNFICIQCAAEQAHKIHTYRETDFPTVNASLNAVCLHVCIYILNSNVILWFVNFNNSQCLVEVFFPCFVLARMVKVIRSDQISRGWRATSLTSLPIKPRWRHASEIDPIDSRTMRGEWHELASHTEQQQKPTIHFQLVGLSPMAFKMHPLTSSFSIGAVSSDKYSFDRYLYRWNSSQIIFFTNKRLPPCLPMKSIWWQSRLCAKRWCHLLSHRSTK